MSSLVIVHMFRIIISCHFPLSDGQEFLHLSSVVADEA